MVTEKQIG